MNTWHLCTSKLTNDDLNAVSALITAIATIILAIFAWKAWLIERRKTAEVRRDRDQGVEKANAAIQSMATRSAIPQAQVPKIRVVGDTMYIDTAGE